MTATIHLKRITVSGWKALREEVDIPLDGKSWLIHGDNEVGKSSIFSSLRFALFESPDAKGKWASGWVNNRSGEARVRVELLINATPYTIEKSRTSRKAGSTTLFQGIGKNRTELCRGRDGVNEILNLIGASERRGRQETERPMDWGILAWLLAPQGIDSVAPARENATSALGLERAISPEMLAVKEHLGAEVEKRLTKRGKPKKGGDLQMAKTNVARLEQDLSDLEERRARYTTLLESLDEKSVLAQTNAKRLTEASKAHEASHQAGIDLTKLEGEIKTLKEKEKAAANAVTLTKEKIGELERIDAELARLKDVSAKTAKKIGKGEAEEIELQKTVHAWEEKKESLENEVKNHIKEIEASHDLLVRLQKARELIRLEKELNDHQALETKITAMKKLGPLPTEEELRGMELLVGRFDTAKSMLSILRSEQGVKVHLKGELDAKWTIDGAETDSKKGMRFGSQLRIDAKMFSLSFSQETGDGRNWAQENADCQEELKALGHSSLDEFRNGLVQQKERAKTLHGLEAEQSKLPSIASLNAQVKELGDVQPLESPSSISTLEREEKSLKSTRKKKEEVLAETNENLKKKRPQLLKLQEKVRTLRGEANNYRELERREAARRDESVGNHGTLQMQNKELTSNKDSHERVLRELKKLVGLRDSEKEAHLDTLKKAQRTKAQLEKDQRNLDSEVITIKRDCKTLGASSLQSEQIRLRSDLALARERYANIEKTARAQERLLNRFQATLTDATDLETGPIRDMVEGWLVQVTQGKWTDIEMDANLVLKNLSGPGGTLESEALASGGLTQVIHALIRLAVATKLHTDNSGENPNYKYPPVAVILDESQPHVDATRALRLMQVFNRQIKAGHVQVIALSHRRDEFQSLEAENYDVARREAYHPDEI